MTEVRRGSVQRSGEKIWDPSRGSKKGLMGPGGAQILGIMVKTV